MSSIDISRSSGVVIPPSTTVPIPAIGIQSRGSLTRCNSYDRDRQLLRKKRQWQRRRDSSVSSSGKYDSGTEDNVNMVETEEPTDISAVVCPPDKSSNTQMIKNGHSQQKPASCLFAGTNSNSSFSWIPSNSSFEVASGV